jgi:hypothetical protein
VSEAVINWTGNLFQKPEELFLVVSQIQPIISLSNDTSLSNICKSRLSNGIVLLSFFCPLPTDELSVLFGVRDVPLKRKFLQTET